MRLVRLMPVAAALVLLGACDEDESGPGPEPEQRSAVIRAAQKTLAAGPARIEAAVRAGSVRYRLDGRLDPVRGYRLCALITTDPRGSFGGRSLWLEHRAGSYGTLTAPTRRCAPRALWLDDHPPTLDLDEVDAGAEDFLHALLVALTGLDDRTVRTSEARACGQSECHRAEVDFGALDRKPRRRDEDSWTLRPLLRSLGRHPVALRVDRDGYLDRVSFTANAVQVDLALSAFGKERHVPLVGRRRFAIE